MEEYVGKLAQAFAHWDYNKMLATKQERAEWLESEATYIKGMIHRAARVPLKPDIKTLQIGTGPCDVIDHWHDGEKHAIDPLAKGFKEKFYEFQDPSVNYITGYGENLPYEDDYFDVVIVRNALDHLDDPYKTLHEIYRVLKPTGALYVWIYLYSWRASLAYRLINLLTKRYKAEPWAFTLGRLKRCLSATGFIPCLPAVEERPNLFREPESVSAWLKQTLKKILGIKHDIGFTGIALPRKGVYEGWKLVGT